MCTYTNNDTVCIGSSSYTICMWETHTLYVHTYTVNYMFAQFSEEEVLYCAVCTLKCTILLQYVTIHSLSLTVNVSLRVTT